MAYNTSAISRTKKQTLPPILGHMEETRSSTRASNGVCGGPDVEQSNCLLSKTEIKALR